MGLFLATAMFVGLSSASPAEQPLRDPFAARTTTVQAEPQAGLADPFARPRPTGTVTATLSDPFAAPRADYGLRDPFSVEPTPSFAPPSERPGSLSDPFLAKPGAPAKPALRDPFAGQS